MTAPGSHHQPLSASLIFHEHDVYANLTVRPFDLQGWGGMPFLFAALIDQVRPTTACEVGVWKGGTTAIMARGLQIQGHGGKMLAVDTWLGEEGFWGQDSTSAKGGVLYNRSTLSKGRLANLHLVNGYPSVYYSFLSNMVHLGLQDTVIPFPLPGTMASSFLHANKVVIDLIHVDGAHRYEDALADIKAWWSLLRPGGVMVGDDYKSWAPGVCRAANEFSRLVGAPIRQDGRKFVMQKPGGEPIRYFSSKPVTCRAAGGGAKCNSESTMAPVALYSELALCTAVPEEYHAPSYPRTSQRCSAAEANLVKRHKAVSAELCGRHCDKYRACQFFIWTRQSQSCTLLRNCIDTRDLTGYISDKEAATYTAIAHYNASGRLRSRA